MSVCRHAGIELPFGPPCVSIILLFNLSMVDTKSFPKWVFECIPYDAIGELCVGWYCRCIGDYVCSTDGSCENAYAAKVW